MTLPTSGALSLNDIKTEFGGPASPSLGDYYAGGTYVPAGTSGTNGAVPSSGTISIGSFYGTSAPVISITNQSSYSSASTPSTATNGYQLSNNGKVYTQSPGGTYNYIEDWVTPNSLASSYEALVTVTSGTLSSGTSGSWVALSSTQNWTVTRSTIGTKTCTFTVEIRKVGTTTVLDSATIDITAEVTL